MGTGGTVEAAVDDEWGEVEAEWRRRDDTRLLGIIGRSGAVGQWASALRDTDLSEDEVAGLASEARGAGADDPNPGGAGLTAAIVAMFDLDDAPGHRATVAALVYLESLRAWEDSDERRQMRGLAVALERALALRPPPDDEAALVAAIVELTWAILEEVDVENGVFCSCPVAAAEHAERTVTRVDAALELLDGAVATPATAGLLRVIRADATVTREFFHDLVEVCDATSRWIGEPGSSTHTLDRAIETARAGVVALGTDVFSSELNTHRVALEHMRAAARRPRLRVAEGTITYLYPFGLPEVPPERLVQRLKAGDDVPATLAGLDVAPDPETVSYGGTWQQEWCLGKHNEAVVLHLPELDIETTASTPEKGTARELPDEMAHVRGLRPEVRLSSLGIHVLRVEVPIAEMELHWLDQAVRRIGETIGREKIRPADGGPQVASYLCRLAERVVEDLRRHVAAMGLGDGDDDRVVAAATVRRDPRAREQDLLASAHVLLSVRRLDVVDGIGTRPCAPDEVAGALGSSILLAPPRSLAAGFEWWASRDIDEVDNLLAGHGLGDGLVVRTLGSTLVYVPDLADWQAGEIDAIAEHVASVSGALHAWGDHLGHYEVMVDADLRGVERDDGPEVIRQRLRELARDASRVRAMLGQVRPVNLCRQASDRVLVERLHAAAGLADVEHAVHDGLEVLSAQQSRLAAEADRLRADRDRLAAREDQARTDRQETVQRRMDLWISVIGLTGVMGFLQYVNTALGVDDENEGVLLVECIVVAAVGIATAVWFLRSHGKAERDRSDGAPGDGAG